MIGDTLLLSEIGESIFSFSAGTALGLSLGSPSEWGIHKYMLHALPKLRKLHPYIEGAAIGHNDNHHGAYKAPEHYYRDVTNEHEIIHFSPGDVRFIAEISALVGTSIEATQALISKDYQFGWKNAAFITGVLAGTMTYYGCYEFTHHYMHVIGKERLAINRELGDAIQGGIDNRDGKLRLSKPLLDDICTMIEFNVDQKNSLDEFRTSLLSPPNNDIAHRLTSQIFRNYSAPSLNPHIEMDSPSSSEILTKTYDIVAKIEEDHRYSLALKNRLKYSLNRRIQRTVRTSPIFQKLDNHHYIHHRKWGDNLNVVFPLMDYLRCTKKDSSRATLEENKDYWLCPNSPDNKPFQRKVSKDKPSYSIVQSSSSSATRAR